jgi:UDP-glucose 4-epimerase
VGADIKAGKHQDVARMTRGDVTGIDTIIHHAGQSSLSASRLDPFADIYHNIEGTVNLLTIAKQAGVRHFIFASTSAVYADDGNLTESTRLEPRIPYGITKLAAEFYIQQSGIPFTIFRYANVYGPGQTKVGESALVPHCLECLIGNGLFKIHGDGNKSRDWIYIDDVVAANIKAVELQPRGIFNIGTETSRSVNYITSHLAALCGKPGYTFTHDDDKPGEAQRTMLMSTKYRYVTNWEPMTILDDGLARTVSAWKDKHNAV